MKSNVLQKLLKPKAQSPEEKLQEFIQPRAKPEGTRKIKKNPGRPRVSESRKARNFTLCLAPQYLEFLDRMTVKDPKVQGRGRKVRFIIERFIEHEKRSLHQMKILRENLSEVQRALLEFGPRVKKENKLELSPKEKAHISSQVERVLMLINLFGHSAKSLQKLLPAQEWGIVSFCLNWKSNRGVRL
jgi:hypothetical protein